MRRARRGGTDGEGWGPGWAWAAPSHPSHCTPRTRTRCQREALPFLQAGGGPLSAGKSEGTRGSLPLRAPLLGHARRRLPAAPREQFLQLRAHPGGAAAPRHLNHAMRPEEPAREPLGGGPAPEPRGPGPRGSPAARPGALQRPQARLVAFLCFLGNPGFLPGIPPFPHARDSAEL